MSNQRDKDQASRSSGGIVGGINDLVNSAKHAVDEASQTPTDRIDNLVEAAKHAVENAQKQAEAAKEAAAQTSQHHNDPTQHARDLVEAAKQAAENAQKQAAAAADRKAADEIRRKAQLARMEAEAAQRAEEARKAEQEEEFHGSGGVGSAEDLDALRRGYIERGLADPSGLTASDDAQSNLDSTNSPTGRSNS